MLKPEVVARTNEIIDRVEALQAEISNLRAFCALLQDLHSRDLALVKEPHAAAVAMVRAAILRAAIGSAMACLDNAREDRASVGQILCMLKDAEVVAALSERRRATTEEAAAQIEQAHKDYRELLKSDSFTRVKRLRHQAVAHLLVSLERPDVSYDMIYKLQESAEQLASDIFGFCAPPHLTSEFLSPKPILKGAKDFWDTYFAGMSTDV